MGPAILKAHFEMMAGYNAWANERVFEAIEPLPVEDFRRELQVAYGSLHKTLNHIYVSDMIWMARFRGQANPPWAFDHIPHFRLEDLKARRTALDRDILGFVLALDETSLMTDINYLTVLQPENVSEPLAPALAHFFNHQTHHRGQCHAMLTRLTGDAPELDLSSFQRGA
ncbi:MAG: DinB family protein [Pseudomonadota bacterium]